jgi:hypothetical protein
VDLRNADDDDVSEVNKNRTIGSNQERTERRYSCSGFMVPTTIYTGRSKLRS